MDPLDVICQSLADNSITEVDLTGNKVAALSDNDVAVLAPYIRANTSLRSLNVSLNHITDDGMKVLARALAGNAHSELRELNVSSNRLTDDGLVPLLDALPPTVTLLDVSGNRLSYRFTEALAAKLQEGRLSITSLQIRDAELEDDVWGINAVTPSGFTQYLMSCCGAASPSGPSKPTALSVLHISGNNFSDRCVPLVANMIARNESLITCNISNSTNIHDYFPIADAVKKNDTLLLFPLGDHGRKIENSSLENKLKENQRIRLRQSEALSIKKLQEEHLIEVKKLQRKHEAEVEGLKQRMVLLEQRLAAVGGGGAQ